jgi:diguanylate cyclase (GGDEF)-like protein
MATMRKRGDASGRQPGVNRPHTPWPVRTYLAVIVGVALLATVAVTASGYFWSSGRSRASAKKEMRLEAQRAAGLISKNTAVAQQTVAQLSAQPGLVKAFAASAKRDCQLSVEGSEAFPSVRVDIVSAAGQVACSSKPSAAVNAHDVHAGSPWLSRALHAHGAIVLWNSSDAATRQPSVVVAAPIPGGAGGKPAGAVVGFEHLTGTGSSLVANVGSARRPSFTVVDRGTRNVIATSVPARKPDDASRFAALKTSGEWAGPDGTTRDYNSADVAGSNWRVYAGLPESTVLSSARGALTRESLVGLAALLILAFSGWMLNRRVAGPLRALSRAVSTAAVNENGKTHVEEAGTAELVSLAQRFNSMIDLRAGHEAELMFQATHDAETGLPNGLHFRERLDETLRLTRWPTGVVVLCLRVNRLDVVNEGYGRGAGDRVLAQVADRLATVLREGDLLARSGGNEFLVLGVNRGEEGATNLAERLHACLEAPFHGPVSDIVLNASVGIALGREDVTSDQLLREADSAMREAGRLGEDVYRFDRALQLRATEHLAVEHALWSALREDQLRVYYQPLVDVASGTITGVEALVRWKRPERGLVLPGEFMAIAEETGQIAAIDRYVLDTACRQAVAWAADGHQLRVSVNVTAAEIGDPAFREFVRDVLRQSGLQPSQLCLEITESSLMREAGRGGEEHLYELRRLGVALSIDDFGTGYSSLSYLHHLPVDELKVDRSFIGGLGRNRRDRYLVEAIVGMARALGLDVVAEGVETRQQLEALGALGCNLAQGYLFARPQAADRMFALLESQWDEGKLGVMA